MSLILSWLSPYFAFNICLLWWHNHSNFLSIVSIRRHTHILTQPRTYRFLLLVLNNVLVRGVIAGSIITKVYAFLYDSGRVYGCGYWKLWYFFRCIWITYQTYISTLGAFVVHQNISTWHCLVWILGWGWLRLWYFKIMHITRFACVCNRSQCFSWLWRLRIFIWSESFPQYIDFFFWSLAQLRNNLTTISCAFIHISCFFYQFSLPIQINFFDFQVFSFWFDFFILLHNELGWHSTSWPNISNIAMLYIIFLNLGRSCLNKRTPNKAWILNCLTLKWTKLRWRLFLLSCFF